SRPAPRRVFFPPAAVPPPRAGGFPEGRGRSDAGCSGAPSLAVRSVSYGRVGRATNAVRADGMKHHHLVLADEGSMSKSPLLRFFVPAVLCAPTLLFADEVFIRGAGSVSGRIVEQTATRVVVDIGGGTV